MKKITYIIFFIFFNLSISHSAGSKIDIPKYDWSWKGFFGTYDRSAAQRGFKVYKEVCSGCHSMNLLSYRNLEELGFNEDQIKVIASDYLIEDGPNDEGDMFEREALPSDRFANPYPNNNAARAANNALPLRHPGRPTHRAVGLRGGSLSVCLLRKAMNVLEDKWLEKE